jgi:hypothetical protein
VSRADAQPVVETAPTDGGDRARLAAERDEEPTTYGCGEGIRGSRQGTQIRDCQFRPQSFGHDLVRRVGHILRGYSPRPDLATQLVPILQFNYWTMVASHRMLLMAASKSPGDLAGYFREHAREERNHDRWLLSDLKANGYFEGNCPLIAASLIGTVMYSIEFLDPCALLGWQIIGECFSLTEDQLTALETVWGTNLLRTIRYHATHDQTHAWQLLVEINNLDGRRQAIVERTALATARMFAAAMQEIAQS